MEMRITVSISPMLEFDGIMNGAEEFHIASSF